MLRRRSLGRCVAAVRSCAPAWHRSHATVSVQAKSVMERFQLTSEDAIGTLPEATALEARLGFLQSIGVPSVANAVRRHPPPVHCEVEDMKPRLEYLLSLGIHEVGPMVERVPLLLSCDIRQDLQRKVVILQTLGLTKVARWLARNPELVHVDLEEEMRPVVVLLRSVQGLKLPRVLNSLGWWHYKDAAGLQAQLDFLGGLVGGDKLGAVVSKNPRILTATRTNVELKASLQPAACSPWLASRPPRGPTQCAPLDSQVEWLKSAGFGDVGALVAKEPKLVMMARESLEPKLQFLLKDMGRSIEEIERYPMVLTYGLQHLQTRHAFLARHSVAEKPSLGRMFRSSLFSFCTKLAKQPLQHLDGQEGEPPGAAETWLEKNVADKAASHARGLAVEEMRRVIMQAATPRADVDAAAMGPTSSMQAATEPVLT